ncbi:MULTISPECIES: N-formylglutamate amidohydrolase [Rhizobium/Agrobacterium group]|uniref:N-formylglutamate amidohydrolase n=1 Tax=Agrobacterium rosae TaxID=1972867 RepID=UPI0020340269|nr:N-formylglutamate amidohydrolase [Agrobacterium rosae]MCM2436077.1 N-formylglutamate amidohydrolase [Agrobacterium rosae]
MLDRKQEGWPTPYEFIAETGFSDIVLVCEHASNFIPSEYSQLGLSDDDVQRHIGWDIGAGEVTRLLAKGLGAAAFLGNYSRLLIDLNRPLGAIDSIPEQSEGTVIPGNCTISARERGLRAELLFVPFHNALSAYLTQRKQLHRTTRLLTIHSFTPVYQGVIRPWDAGVLYASAREFAQRVLTGLKDATAFNIVFNEPYRIDRDSDYAILVHGDDRAIDAVLLEIRNDHIGDQAGVREWAGLLAGVITESR